MSKHPYKTPSRAERREALAKKKADQKRLYTIIGGVVAVLIIALIVWQVWPEPEAEPAADSTEGAVVEGERPLAALSPAERNNYYNVPPEMTIDTDKTYEAIITTEKGEMRFELFDDQAPVTVNNFVFLAKAGWYDNVPFHRVLEGFMAQAGDPSGLGFGGPGYVFDNEVTGIKFDKEGLVAMANAGVQDGKAPTAASSSSPLARRRNWTRPIRPRKPTTPSSVK